MIDKDNTFAYSRIVALDGQAGARLIVFPNPVKTVAKLDITDPDMVGTNAAVIDANGRTRKQFGITAQSQEINVQQLSTGSYWIRLHDGQVVKFVKE